MQFRLILWLAVLAIALLFVVQNALFVGLRFLVWRITLSQALLFFFVLAVDVGPGWTLHVCVSRPRARRERRQLKRG
jgi:uncharacterized integral membrane protein